MALKRFMVCCRGCVRDSKTEALKRTSSLERLLAPLMLSEDEMENLERGYRCNVLGNGSNADSLAEEPESERGVKRMLMACLRW
jgi:hypothetical protein